MNECFAITKQRLQHIDTPYTCSSFSIQHNESPSDLIKSLTFCKTCTESSWKCKLPHDPTAIFEVLSLRIL